MTELPVVASTGQTENQPSQAAAAPTGEANAPGSELRGVVRFEDGTPVPLAEIVVLAANGAGSLPTRADDRGAFLVAIGGQGPFTVVASAPDTLVWAERQVQPEEVGGEVEIFLPAPACLFLTVSGEQGEPLAAEVWIIMLELGDAPKRMREGLKVRAGMDGVARVDGLPLVNEEEPLDHRPNSQSDHLLVSLNCDGYFSDLTHIQIHRGPNRVSLTMRKAPPDLMLSGWITLPDGTPAGRIPVEFFQRGTASNGLGDCVTAADGHFEFPIRGSWLKYEDDGRIRGFVRVVATSPSTAATMLDLRGLDGGKARSDVRIRLDAGAVIEGVVLDEEGKPFEDAKVCVAGDEADRANDMGWREFPCDKEGRYRAILPSTGLVDMRAEAGNASPEPEEEGAPASNYSLSERPAHLNFRLQRWPE